MKTYTNDLKTYIGLNEDAEIAPLFEQETLDLIQSHKTDAIDRIDTATKILYIEEFKKCTTYSEVMAMIEIAEENGYHNLVQEWTRVFINSTNENI